MKKCPKCNVEVADNAKFCSDCGYAFPEPVVPPPAPTNIMEKSEEENFDHKPLVMDWYNSNGFVKFLFNVWPKLNGIGVFVSIILTIAGVFLGGFGIFTNIPDVGELLSELLPDSFNADTGFYLLSTGVGLRVFLLVVNMFCHNELKKWLFVSYLKKKEIDLDVATKYVFFNLSHDNFSSVPRKEKGNLVAWLGSPQYFGEAVMMAANASSKKANIIWTCVWAGVNFVAQTVQNSFMLSFVYSFFNLDFNDVDTLTPLGGNLLLFLVVSIALSIATAIVNGIYSRKRAEIKAVWAITATNPDAANKEIQIISA